MALRNESEAPLTEPEIIPCLYLTGGAIEVNEHTLRFVGWCEPPHLGGEMEERRVVVRLAIPMDVALDLWAEFGREIERMKTFVK